MDEARKLKAEGIAHAEQDQVGASLQTFASAVRALEVVDPTLMQRAREAAETAAIVVAANNSAVRKAGTKQEQTQHRNQDQDQDQETENENESKGVAKVRGGTV